MRQLITNTDSALLLSLLACCWLGTLVVGGIIAIYVKSILDARSGSHYYRRCARCNSYDDDDDDDDDNYPYEELRKRDKRITKLRKRKKRFSSPRRNEHEQKTSNNYDQNNSRSRFNQVYNLNDSLSEPSDEVSISGDSTADDEPHLPQKEKVLTETASAFSEKKNESQRKPMVTIHPNQQAYESKCRHLIGEIIKEKSNVNPIDKLIVDENKDLSKLRHYVHEFRQLFEDLSMEFRSDRQAYVTTMILCCNVIVELDALSLLKAVGELYSEMETDTQYVIETVVPNIWSI